MTFCTPPLAELARDAIVGVSMLLLGQWLANRIESGVVQAEAAAAALYTDGFIEPHVQELTHGTSISPRKAQLLDELLSPKTIGKPIVGFRIWQGNTIVHSNRSELIGRTFPPSARRDKAWQGHVASYYQAHGSEDYRTDEAPKRPILEIYAPVRETGAQRIIALAETYEIVSTLPEALSAARREGWIIVVSAGIAVLALLSGIVEKGSQAIEASKTALNAQVSELSRLLAENNRLQQRVSTANLRVTEMNERYLRRLGADLHDGPLQLLGMAMLRIDTLSDSIDESDPVPAAETKEDVIALRDAIKEAIREIRNVSAGLFVPEVEKLSISDALDMAIRRHERWTSKPVRRDLGSLPDELSYPLKSCLYRFVQEGLVNSFRHADGNGLAVAASCIGDELAVEISDGGPGFDPLQGPGLSGGQGLAGLRDRIAALGGEFDIASAPGRGTRLRATFHLKSDLSRSSARST